jgi:hypothetical protein
MIGTSLLAGCIYGSGDPPPLPPLAEDQAQPALALLEHVLADHFARAEPGQALTTCASLAPGGLTMAQEKALIARFPRLAPVARCRTSGAATVDAETGAPAVVVQVYEFACTSGSECAGWAAVPGQPAARFGMRWSEEGWRFVRDARLIAE